MPSSPKNYFFGDESKASCYHPKFVRISRHRPYLLQARNELPTAYHDNGCTRRSLNINVVGAKLRDHFPQFSSLPVLSSRALCKSSDYVLFSSLLLCYLLQSYYRQTQRMSTALCRLILQRLCSFSKPQLLLKNEPENGKYLHNTGNGKYEADICQRENHKDADGD